MNHIPQPIIAIPNTETIDTAYGGTLDPWGKSMRHGMLQATSLEFPLPIDHGAAESEHSKSKNSSKGLMVHVRYLD